MTPFFIDNFCQKNCNSTKLAGKIIQPIIKNTLAFALQFTHCKKNRNPVSSYFIIKYVVYSFSLLLFTTGGALIVECFLSQLDLKTGGCHPSKLVCDNWQCVESEVNDN